MDSLQEWLDLPKNILLHREFLPVELDDIKI